MKTVNYKHEFDGIAVNIKDIINRKKKNFSIFGAGLIGGDLIRLVEKMGRVRYYIDNNNTIKELNGYKVVSLNEYQKLSVQSLIVLAVSDKYRKEIEAQLRQHGLIENTDYIYYVDFIRRIVPVYMAYEHEKAYMELAQICITERCTLKCLKCAHGCYAVGNEASDMSFEEVCSNADSLFSKIDYINEFVLIGGEPLLNQNLSRSIEYVGNRYRNKMNIFSITTNGTLLPNADILQMCKKYDVLYRISNYTSSIPGLKKQYSDLVILLKQTNVKYRFGMEEKTWYDYGFDNLHSDGVSEEELIKRFDRCNTPCRDVHDNKLYFCVMARAVSENLGYFVGKSDCLDLKRIKNGREGVIELLEFNQGYSSKGYLDMCARCYGAERIKYPVKAAEQRGNFDV